MVALSSEDSWFVLTTKRSSEVNKLKAGISQVIAALLKVFFNTNGHNFHIAGITITFPDGTSARIWATLKVIVQDALAHKTMWNCKGSSGIRFCMSCKNIVSLASGLSDEDATGYFKHFVARITDCDLHTNASIL